ncbi:putative oxidoreductase [Xylophilus ampelinus]|nr:FdhF/YdeP family oxidoreductase [Variovorax sp.]VTY39159.1 putative oxidoreductase [Xylophilus ampelinus]
MTNMTTPPAGGWGSLKAVSGSLLREHIPIAGAAALLRQNKAGGFACVSCAWPKPGAPRVAEFCENGAKATAWELTDKRLAPDFFAAHTVSELRAWSDHALEAGGRLTAPMRYEPGSDRYVETGWDEAFAAIGLRLKALREQDADATVFYASGRASLEASYLYQLLARLYGNNNLPDSSNMCHESTSVALPETIGVPVGTVTLEDFEHTDCILFFGQNPGVNSPRMLHPLKDARDRGVPIVTFNPLREPGLTRFVDPQSPLQMLTPADTAVSTHYLQVRVGGDIAAVAGVCKALLALDARVRERGDPAVIDHAFIAEHTQGFDGFVAWLDGLAWEDLCAESALPRAALEEVAVVVSRARAAIVVYGMGLTQHRRGVENVQMLTNLLLMGGHIGRRGAGICPVRGHSNVQGQRTVGISEKPELVPLDRLQALYGFEPPRHKGRATVETCEGVLDGSVRAFVGLGGNFLRAVPDTDRIEPAWERLALTVHVATKLNHTHLVPGREAWLLPCLGRIEKDRQDGVEQVVSVEDSSGFIHASHGVAEPAAPALRSEVAIVAGIALATLAPNPRVPWQNWTRDYARVREAIEATWPEVFADFNARFEQPGGFAKPNAARERRWKTESGKAQFKPPEGLAADPDLPVEEPDVLRLMTMRSDDQFNTTIYSLDDRFRGIVGTRQVLLLNPHDIERLGFEPDALVDAHAATGDGVARTVRALRLVAYDIPRGCAAGYFPECNPLLPLWHRAARSHVPAAKWIPVRLQAHVPSAPPSSEGFRP